MSGIGLLELLLILFALGCTTAQITQEPSGSGNQGVPITNIAHRGASALAPENTLAAFRRALRDGAGMCELDVHLSLDGEVVVIHDDTLERTTNIEDYYQTWRLEKGVQVSSLPLEKLKMLDAGTWFVEEDAKRALASGVLSPDEAEAYRGEPIPTLKEVLAFADESGMIMNVEIKQIPRFYEDIAERVVAAVKGMKNKDLVLISSFDHEICRQVHGLDSTLGVAPICSNRIADPGRYVQEILGGCAYHPSGTLLGLGDGRPKDAPLINREDIASAQRHGVAVNVWTINDRKSMERMVRAGVDGIMTDYPHVLKAVLDKGR
jgi:glycerophosphoryl diester phosphodiesterase